MPTFLSSVQNPHIKELARLEKRKVRDERQVTLVEGEREVSRALAMGVIPLEAYLCLEILQRDEVAGQSPLAEKSGTTKENILAQLLVLEKQRQTRLFTVTPEVFAKIAYRGESGGVVLEMPYLQRRLAELPLTASPFLVVIEGVEKPGNLGAILRTADAAGVDGLIVATGATDLHNPNVVRASLGTLFTVPVAEATSQQVVNFLRESHIQIVIADPSVTTPYTSLDYTQAIALVLGSEAHGLSAIMHQAATTSVTIPMHGQADSLNLSTATAILLYEVVRQRGKGWG